MSQRTLVFYFDVISHNAYVAFARLKDLAGRYDLNVKLEPVLFGAMLKRNGQLGPAEIKEKGRWMTRDVLRKAQQLGIELNPPANHPFNPLWALRCLTAVPDGDDRWRLADALFRAVWVDARDVSDADQLKEVLADAGFDPASLLADAAAADNKGALRVATDAALDAGVFGVPSMLVGGEVYWGFDDFPVLEDVLSGRDVLDQDELARWYLVTPAVTRQR